jgi:hypothetical protein
MTQQHKQKLTEIFAGLFFIYDPAGLNDICPEDEYVYEAFMVLSQPELFESEERLAGGIYAVFLACLGANNIAPAQDPLYVRLAQECLFAKAAVEGKAV